MKKYFILIYTLIVVSCVKDHGNYNYSDLSSYSIANMDSFYYKDGNNLPLIITPEVHNPDGTIANDSDFTYKWRIYGMVGYSISGRTIGEEKKLEYYPAKLASNVASGLGVFKCYFRATNRKSGLFVEKLFTMSVGSTTYEGWLALTEKNDGNSRLDMVSIRNGVEDSVVQNVLDLVKSTFPTNSPPRFINCNYAYVGYPTTRGMAMLIATENNASFLEYDSLKYSVLYELKGRSNYTFPNYKKLEYTSSYLQGIFGYNNQLLPLRYGSTKIDQPINIYKGKIFKASPFVGLDNKIPTTNLPSCIVYNMDIHGFLRIPNLNDAKEAVDLPTGSMFNFVDTTTNLVYMKFTGYNAGKVSALLKSEKDGGYYVLRFSTAGVQELYSKITFSTITSSKFYAFDPTFGYLFYVTNDNKLYEYDPVAQTNTLMVDFGNEHVSLLQFTDFANEDINESHKALASKLCISTYKVGDLEKSGKFYLYTVTSLNAPLQLYKNYSGLGKVVSLAYKYN